MLHYFVDNKMKKKASKHHWNPLKLTIAVPILILDQGVMMKTNHRPLIHSVCSLLFFTVDK